MDNNTVERGRCGEPVVGRKNYAWGRGVLWSGQLLVQMFSLLATLKIWGLNPWLWLTAYLEAARKLADAYPASPVDGCPGTCRKEQQPRLGQAAPAFHDLDLTKRATNQEVAGRGHGGFPGTPGGRRSGRET